MGVDYALFIVTRHRQGLVGGRDAESSIINAVNTSGRAVLFAGIIVCIALLGMFALGVSFLYGLAVAAAIGVALTMVAALTLLPALFGFIGPKVMSRKQKRNLAENGPRVVGADSKGFWPKWADRVQRYPWVSAGVALVILAAIALPFFSLPPGLGRPGHRPGGHADPGRLRHALEGVRTRLQRPPAAGRRWCSRTSTRSSTTSSARCPQQSDVVKVATPLYIPSKTGNGDVVAGQRLSRARRPRTAATTNLVNHLRATIAAEAGRDRASTCWSAARPPSTSTSPTS